MLKAGDTFTRGNDNFRNGYREVEVLTVKVTEVVEGYTDPWSKRQCQFGVRFELTSNLDDHTTYCNLPLDTFNNVWVS